MKIRLFIIITVLLLPCYSPADEVDTKLFWHTVKYNPAGDEQWSNFCSWWLNGYDPGGVLFLGLDGVGDLYCLGHISTYDVGGGAIKYSAAGDLLWGSGTSHHLTTAAAIIDSTGNSYLAGSDYFSENSILIQKFAPDGSSVWEQDYQAAGPAVVRAMAVDSTDNFYLVGEATRTSVDFFALKLDSAGNRQWVNFYGSERTADSATAVVIDSNDNVFVAGNCGINIAAVKYDADGNLLWEAYYPPVTTEEAVKASLIKIDEEGNTIIAGTYTTYPDRHLLALKFDQDGQLLWSYIFAEQVNDTLDKVLALALEDTGSAYLGGFFNYGSYQANIVIKLNSNGLLEKLLRPEGLENQMVLAVDPGRNLFVYGTDGQDFITIKYDENGDQLWRQAYHTSDEGFGYSARAIVVDADGNAIIAGDYWERRPEMDDDSDDDTPWPDDDTPWPDDDNTSPDDDTYLPDDDTGDDDSAGSGDDSADDDTEDSECDDFCQRATECSLWDEVGIEQLECDWRCPELNEGKLFCVLAAGDCAAMKECFQLGDVDDDVDFGCNACGG